MLYHKHLGYELNSKLWVVVVKTQPNNSGNNNYGLTGYTVTGLHGCGLGALSAKYAKTKAEEARETSDPGEPGSIPPDEVGAREI